MVASGTVAWMTRSEEHTSELQSQSNLVCRLLLEKNDFRIVNLASIVVTLAEYNIGHGEAREIVYRVVQGGARFLSVFFFYSALHPRAYPPPPRPILLR